MAKQDHIHNVVQYSDRDWAALVKDRFGCVEHERVPKKDLDPDVQVDAVRFFKCNPDQVAVQLREKTDGESIVMMTAKIPINQFVFLAESFLRSMRQQ